MRWPVQKNSTWFKNEVFNSKIQFFISSNKHRSTAGLHQPKRSPMGRSKCQKRRRRDGNYQISPLLKSITQYKKNKNTLQQYTLVLCTNQLGSTIYSCLGVQSHLARCSQRSRSSMVHMWHRPWQYSRSLCAKVCINRRIDLDSGLSHRCHECRGNTSNRIRSKRS